MKKINKKNIIWIVIALVFLVIYLMPKKEVPESSDKSYIGNPRLLTKLDSLKIAVPKTNNNISMLDKSETDVSLLSRLVNPSLFYKDKHNNVKKEIAKDYWYENDGKTIAVTLRDDFEFSNGKQLNTENILYTYKILSDPSFNGNEFNVLENLEGFYQYKIRLSKDFEGVEVLGKNFIKFHFKTANLSNINALMYPILNVEQEDYKYNDVEKIDRNKILDGAGRYRVSHYNDKSVKLVLKNSPRNKNIKVKNIEIFSLNYIDAIKKLKKGELDILHKYARTENLDRYMDNRLYQFSTSIDNQSYNYSFLGFHKNSKLFKNKEYRRGLRNSIDIKKMVESEIGKDIYDFPNIPVYNNSWFNVKKLDFKDKTKLSEALEKNYRKSGKYFVDQDNKALEIKLVYSKDDDFFNQILKDFIESIEKQGVKVSAEALSTKDMYKAISGEINYDIYVSQRKMSEVPQYKYEENYAEVEGYTITNIMEDGFLYLLEKVKIDTNDPFIVQISDRWKDSFEETTPYIVLATQNVTSIINNRIEGIYLNEFVGLDNIENLKNINFVE